MIDHFQGFKLGVKQNEFDSFTPFLTLHARAFLLYEGCHLRLYASAILLQKSSPEGWIGFSPWGACHYHHIKNCPSVLVSFHVSAHVLGNPTNKVSHEISVISRQME